MDCLTFPWNGELRLFDSKGFELSAASPLPESSRVSVFRAARVATEVLVKRIPAHLLDASAVRLNIELSAAVENEQRLASGMVHVLRTLTCHSGRPGDAASPYVYVALEYCTTNLCDAVENSRRFARDLEKLQGGIVSFDEDKYSLLLWRARRSVARQLISGVAFLHRTGVGELSRIFHNALHPANVLLKNGIVKLAELNAWSHNYASHGGGVGWPATSPRDEMGGGNRGPPAAAPGGVPAVHEQGDAVASSAALANAFKPRISADTVQHLQQLGLAVASSLHAAPSATYLPELPQGSEASPRSAVGALSPQRDAAAYFAALDEADDQRLAPEELLYRMRAYPDTFALGCLIFYTLTLGRHPFGSLRLEAQQPRGDGAPSSASAAETATGGVCCMAARRIGAGVVPRAGEVSEALAAAARDARNTTDKLVAALQAWEESAGEFDPEFWAPTAAVGNALAADKTNSGDQALSTSRTSEAAVLSQLEGLSLAAAADGATQSGPPDRLRRGAYPHLCVHDSTSALIAPKDGSASPLEPRASHMDAGDAPEQHGLMSEIGDNSVPSSAAYFRGAGAAATPFDGDGALRAQLSGRNAAFTPLPEMAFANGLPHAVSTPLPSLEAAGLPPRRGHGGDDHNPPPSPGPAGKSLNACHGGAPAQWSRGFSQSGPTAAVPGHRSPQHPQHHSQHTTAVDTVDHEEAADLVLSLIDEVPARRITPGDALAHPFFWSAARKLTLLTLASEGTVVNGSRAYGRHATFAAELQRRLGSRLPESAGGRWGPLFPLPPSLQAPVGGPRGAGGYDPSYAREAAWSDSRWPHRADPVAYEAIYLDGPYNMYGLLRYSRNLYVHGPSVVRSGLFPSLAHVEAHILGAFPWLALEVWKADMAVNEGRFTAQTLSAEGVVDVLSAARMGPLISPDAPVTSSVTGWGSAGSGSGGGPSIRVSQAGVDADADASPLASERVRTPAVGLLSLPPERSSGRPVREGQGEEGQGGGQEEEGGGEDAVGPATRGEQRLRGELDGHHDDGEERELGGGGLPSVAWRSRLHKQLQLQPRDPRPSTARPPHPSLTPYWEGDPPLSSSRRSLTPYWEDEAEAANPSPARAGPYIDRVHPLNKRYYRQGGGGSSGAPPRVPHPAGERRPQGSPVRVVLRNNA